MLTSAHIRNYRKLRDLEIPELRRINVFTGSNGSGKTSLLEALFLLSRGGDPNDLMNGHIVRNEFFDTSTRTVPPRTLWKSLFSGLDDSREIAITAQDSVHGTVKLTLNLDTSHNEVPSSTANQAREHAVQGNPYAIFLEFRSTSDIENYSSLRDGNGECTSKNERFDGIPYNSMFIPKTHMRSQALVENIESIEIENQMEPIISTLRLLEPNLRGIQNVHTDDQFGLWADIGLEEFLPLGMLGDGTQWVAQMMVSLITVRNGLLLVDGIEDAIHHSLLARVWTAIHSASILANAQVIATTDSYECISALSDSVDLRGFYIHRLESTGERSRCVTYGEAAISGAMDFQFEVR